MRASFGEIRLSARLHRRVTQSEKKIQEQESGLFLLGQTATVACRVCGVWCCAVGCSGVRWLAVLRCVASCQTAWDVRVLPGAQQSPPEPCNSDLKPPPEHAVRMCHLCARICVRRTFAFAWLCCARVAGAVADSSRKCPCPGGLVYPCPCLPVRGSIWLGPTN